MGEHCRTSRQDQFRHRADGRSDPRSPTRYRPFQFQGPGRDRRRAAQHDAIVCNAGVHRQGHSRERGDSIDAGYRRHEFARVPAEVAMLTRRYFDRSSSIAVAGMGSAPSWLLRAASPEQNKKKILISIFQRGAADGLNIVVPFSEKRYYDLRPTIAVPAPGKPNGAI